MEKKITRNQLLNQFFNLTVEKNELEYFGTDPKGVKMEYKDLVDKVNEINFQLQKLQILILNFNK